MYQRSKVLASLDDRMEDVQLLLESHKHATMRSQRDRLLLEARSIAEYLDAMRTAEAEPGRGRPPALGALSRAAIVLLSAQLQGYFEDVYDEAAESLLRSKVKDLQALTIRGKSGFWNPRPQAIDSLFASLGFAKTTRNIHWPNFTNKQVRARLEEYVDLRNKIAHGERVPVRKTDVTSMKGFVERFAGRFDKALFGALCGVTGEEPW